MKKTSGSETSLLLFWKTNICMLKFNSVCMWFITKNAFVIRGLSKYKPSLGIK